MNTLIAIDAEVIRFPLKCLESFSKDMSDLPKPIEREHLCLFTVFFETFENNPF
jgi:hypothetical protein